MATANNIVNQLLKVGLNIDKQGKQNGGNNGNPVNNDLVVSILNPYFESIKRGNDEIQTDVFTNFSEISNSHSEEMDKLMCTEPVKEILKNIFHSNEEIKNFFNSEESVNIPIQLKTCIESLYPVSDGEMKGGILGVNLSNAAIKTALGATSLILSAAALTVYMSEILPPVLLYNFLTGNVTEFAGDILQIAIETSKMADKIKIIEDKKEIELEIKLNNVISNISSGGKKFKKSSRKTKRSSNSKKNRRTNKKR